MGVRIRPAIAALPAYKAGKSRLGAGPAYKLSSNEVPYPPLPQILEAVQDSCNRMNRYPDMSNAAIAEALAAALTTPEVPVGAENLAFGTGSVGVLYHLLQAVCEAGDEVVHAWRSFEAYPIAIQVCGAVGIPVPLRADATHDLPAMLAAVTERTRAVMICSPNNPTGPVVHHDELVRFLDAVPSDVLVVVDEAYVEFVTDPAVARGLDLWWDWPNVAVLRTFSKAYGLAGFRAGYAVAEPDLAAAVRAVALPFGVGVGTQAGILAALSVQDQLLERVATIVRAREEMVAGLRSLGFQLPQCQGNFVWFAAGPQTMAYADGFAERGLIVRPYADGAPSDGVRVTVGEPEPNKLVLEVAATLPR